MYKSSTDSSSDENFDDHESILLKSLERRNMELLEKKKKTNEDLQKRKLKIIQELERQQLELRNIENAILWSETSMFSDSETLVSPMTSQIVSPKASQRVSPGASPLVSPKASPLVSPNASPRVSPNTLSIHEPLNLNMNLFQDVPPPLPLTKSFQNHPRLSSTVWTIEQSMKFVTSGLYLEESRSFNQNTPDEDMQPAKTHIENTAPEDIKGEDDDYVGKGKIAKNPHFRYVKRSKPEVSSRKSTPQETTSIPLKDSFAIPKANTTESKLPKDSLNVELQTPVKSLQRESDSPEEKSPISKSPKAVFQQATSVNSPKETSVSPEKSKSLIDDDAKHFSTLKRKPLDFDKSCGSSSDFSLLGNTTDDNGNKKIAKKLKSNGSENTRKQFPAIVNALSQPSHLKPHSSHQIDQSKNDQSSSEMDDLPKPSTSGLPKVDNCASSSEESELFNANDNLPLSEIEGSSLTSESENEQLNDRCELLLTCVSNFIKACAETSNESSFTNIDES